VHFVDFDFVCKSLFDGFCGWSFVQKFIITKKEKFLFFFTTLHALHARCMHVHATWFK